MITLVVASTNPVKIQAAVNGYQRLFPGSELNLAKVVPARSFCRRLWRS